MLLRIRKALVLAQTHEGFLDGIYFEDQLLLV